MTTQRRLFTVAVALPTITTSLGIDGGPIFQIAATENLGLSSRALGIAFGLGILSVPLQLWAARLPLHRARRHIQLFLAVASAMCVVMAVLVAAGDDLAWVALGLTVLAEISLSVLYATSWQPLVSSSLSTEARQRLNSKGYSAAGATRAGAALLFGAVGQAARVAFYAVAAAVAVGLARVLGGVDFSRPDAQERAITRKVAVPPAMRPLYVAVGLTAAGAWPLFIVFVDKVLWPDVNLGLVAAVQVTGSLLAAAFWRSTAGDVAGRARWAATTSLVAAAVLAAIPGRVDSAGEQVAFFAATAGAAAATTIVFLTIMEMAHRVIDADTSVRAMTFYDVVASTSMQAGLLVACFVIEAGSMPYRLYLVGMSAATLVATAANASMSGSTE